MQIAAGVRAAQMESGCRPGPVDDARLAAIARSNASAMASADRLDADDPAGSPFDQMERMGIAYRDAGALYAATRRGPDDVLMRWRGRGDTAEMLRRCDTHLGAAVVTAASGMSYVAVVLARL
ncbi:MAG: hypothetical protein RMK74_12230 [Myxococcales bacterium]|nr:hypothetical protein [Myxococcales bacterium]